ncbi:PEPxxWA-CTERM sorting domain-containing protein [Phenylobacterium sp.]|uniref:PEPxxWA-CTERM sorting domain-containing protein n=1 Tax=Phenylobacterium sp. TaxID=1871053 RepID=UPI0025D8029A|nr:PEPxxWA-CTERM sorting domain-containing protein [Phenylobacterium sp.]
MNINSFSDPNENFGFGCCNIHVQLLNGGESPAPEPATWALMIVGFGSAGAMLRRTRLAQA